VSGIAILSQPFEVRHSTAVIMSAKKKNFTSNPKRIKSIQRVIRKKTEEPHHVLFLYILVGRTNCPNGASPSAKVMIAIMGVAKDLYER
jgi:ABC-type hemin transport system substrate-binding protein